jgi:hypothetical protein
MLYLVFLLGTNEFRRTDVSLSLMEATATIKPEARDQRFSEEKVAISFF